MGSDLDRLLRQGLARQHAGQKAEAVDAYRKVLAVDPACVDALQLLGILTHQMGDSIGGARLIAEAVRLAPRVDAFRLNQAVVLHAMKDYAGAAQAYRVAAELAPGNAAAWRGLGLELIAAQQHAEAVEPLLRAVQLTPEDGQGLNGLGIALGRIERFADALPYLQKADAIRPDARTQRNIGVMLHRMGRLAEAREVLGRLTQQHPQFGENFDLLGLVLTDQGDLTGALAAFERAVALSPDEPQPLLDLANATANLGRAAEAAALYRKLVARWPRADAWSNLCLTDLYRDDIAEADVVAAHTEAAAFFAGAGEAAGAAQKTGWARSGARDANRALRVGYLSPDFYRHPVSQFLLPLLSNHDPCVVHVVGVSLGTRADDATRRIRDCCVEWLDLRLVDDATAVRQLRDAKLDVLVDLAGHTGSNRLAVVAARVAPVQLSYLGYPIGTGLRAIDRRIGDALADSGGDVETAEERVMRLDRVMWCYEPWPEAPAVTHRSAVNAADGVVFGSFNNWQKVTLSTIRAWSEILRRVPGSRLLLKSGALADEGVRQAALAMFASNGVTQDRLEFRGKVANISDHLSAYGDIDVALDPWPYNGTTTTCDAMWMGVPVVTLEGRTHRARVGASLVTAVGLGDMVCRTVEEYLGLALGLARDAARRSTLRASLRERMRASALCDGAGLARTMEGIYRNLVTESHRASANS